MVFYYQRLREGNNTMINREYNINRRNANKAHKEVITTLEKFAKRSKNIAVVRKNSFWGLCRIDLSIHKDGKVAQEMMEYLKNLCSYCEKEKNTIWFHNYDTCAIVDAEDEWDVKFEICVSLK
jgi:hypothetical protein